MKTSESITDIAAALASAQGEMKSAKKDAVNPHFRSAYADLASVWEAIREPLKRNGLAVVQAPEDATDGKSVVVATRLIHKSGQWIESSMSVPVAQATAQGRGSAITYGRRYGLMAVVGVAADDDDGNAASGRAQDRPSRNDDDILAEEAAVDEFAQRFAEVVEVRGRTEGARADIAVRALHYVKAESAAKVAPGVREKLLEAVTAGHFDTEDAFAAFKAARAAKAKA